MSTRNVIVPEPIIAINPHNGKPIPTIEFDSAGKQTGQRDDDPWTLYRFLLTYVFDRPEWRKPLSRARRGGKILDAFEGAQPGDIVELTDAEWRETKTTLESDNFEIPQFYGRQLLPLADAILDASDKRLEAVADNAS